LSSFSTTRDVAESSPRVFPALTTKRTWGSLHFSEPKSWLSTALRFRALCRPTRRKFGGAVGCSASPS